MVYNREYRNTAYMNFAKLSVSVVLAGIALVGGALGMLFLNTHNNTSSSKDLPELFSDTTPKKNNADIPSLPPTDMTRMKRQGCVTDGLLSGYGGREDALTAMVNRSNCYYLHRAIETWLEPPDFEKAKRAKAKITRNDVIYGMFIAEAIDKKADYFYPPENRKFNFRDMCRKGGNNAWGEHTCQPSFETREYSLYVQYITKQAIDMGVQSFLFGQVYLQDTHDRKRSLLPEVMRNMRNYAHSQGVPIVIGAQTNDIDDPEYLGMFDFIEGGIGLHTNGSIENGPCFSRWWKKEGDWCWALLWNDRFASKANTVLVHLDWSGKIGDDMSTFAKMPEDMRQKTIRRLHKDLTKENVGFLIPFLAPLPEKNGGCYGPKETFYAADNQYTCKDEDAFNALLKASAP